MFKMSKIALAASLVVATSTLALATEFDSNMANRYPAYNESIAATAPAYDTLQTAPVRLRDGRDPAVRGSQFEIEHTDRASSPYQGGGY